MQYKALRMNMSRDRLIMSNHSKLKEHLKISNSAKFKGPNLLMAKSLRLLHGKCEVRSE
jgi:hypothetical protein